MATFEDRLIFALAGSTMDLIGGAVPNYRRSSPLWLEEEVSGNLSLKKISPHNPAFLENGTIYLEGASINEATYNTDLDRDEWVKGENVSIQKDKVNIPSNRLYGDRAIFAGDRLQVREKNIMFREFDLEPHTEYVFSILLRQWNGNFGPIDNITISGGVVNAEIIDLSQLNNSLQKYAIKSAQFTTAGTDLTEYSAIEWEINSVIDDLFLIESTDSTSSITIAEDELVGSLILVDGKGSYTIAGNSEKQQNNDTLEIRLSTPSNLQLPEVGDLLQMQNAQNVNVRVEIFCESAVIFDIAAIKVEANNYRTSLNFQIDTVESLPPCEIEYQKSPLAGLKDFALLIEIEFWRGKANLFKTDNFEIWAENNTLTIIADANTLTHSPLPQEFALLVNCVESKSVLQFYLDGKSIGTIDESFTGGKNSALNFTQATGVIAIKQVLIRDASVTDVESAFDSINAIALSVSRLHSNGRSLYLHELTIPAATNSTVKSFILDINPAKKAILLDSVEGFSVGDEVAIIRYVGVQRTGSPSSIFPPNETKLVLSTVVQSIDTANSTIGLRDGIGTVNNRDWLIKTIDSETSVTEVEKVVEIVVESHDNTNVTSIQAADESVSVKSIIVNQILNPLATINTVDYVSADFGQPYIYARGLEVSSVNDFTVGEAILFDGTAEIGKIFITEIDFATDTLKLRGTESHIYQVNDTTDPNNHPIQAGQSVYQTPNTFAYADYDADAANNYLDVDFIERFTPGDAVVINGTTILGRINIAAIDRTAKILNLGNISGYLTTLGEIRSQIVQPAEVLEIVVIQPTDSRITGLYEGDANIFQGNLEIGQVKIKASSPFVKTTEFEDLPGYIYTHQGSNDLIDHPIQPSQIISQPLIQTANIDAHNDVSTNSTTVVAEKSVSVNSVILDSVDGFTLGEALVTDGNSVIGQVFIKSINISTRAVEFTDRENYLHTVYGTELVSNHPIQPNQTISQSFYAAAAISDREITVVDFGQFGGGEHVFTPTIDVDNADRYTIGEATVFDGNSVVGRIFISAVDNSTNELTLAYTEIGAVNEQSNPRHVYYVQGNSQSDHPIDIGQSVYQAPIISAKIDNNSDANNDYLEVDFVEGFHRGEAVVMYGTNVLGRIFISRLDRTAKTLTLLDRDIYLTTMGEIYNRTGTQFVNDELALYQVSDSISLNVVEDYQSVDRTFSVEGQQSIAVESVVTNDIEEFRLGPADVNNGGVTIGQVFVEAIIESELVLVFSDRPGYIYTVEGTTDLNNHPIQPGTTISQSTTQAIEQVSSSNKLPHPGRAIANFPFFSDIEKGEIEGILNNSTLELDAVGDLELGRIFICDRLYRIKQEGFITAIDLDNRRITIESSEGLLNSDIEIGDALIQPNYETIISPANYYALLTEQIEGVVISQKYQNAIVVENYNSFPVKINPVLKLAI